MILSNRYEVYRAPTDDRKAIRERTWGLKMTSKVLLLGFFAFSLTSVVDAQTGSPHHPLDALTTDEYWTVHDALQESGRLTDKTLVSSLLLHEPVKDKVLA